MLIRAPELLRELSERKRALEQATLERPAADYAMYLAACAEWRVLAEMERLIAAKARQEDDEKGR